MKVLVIDNYDSFTYNLVHLVADITGREPEVWKNDGADLDALEGFDRILLSPGPGLPAESGQLQELIRRSAGKVPILGVCLGHQAIAEVFGAVLENLEQVFHGVATRVIVEEAFADRGIFRGLPRSFETGRYHSWVVSEKNFPGTLAVTARDEAGTIMAMKHRSLDIESVQFHPESVLTPVGRQLLANWLQFFTQPINKTGNESESMRHY
jgi:anthranilate synthase component 2